MAYVGDVHDMPNVEVAGFEETSQQIGEQKRTEIADVGKVIDSRTATVHLDAASGERLEPFYLVCQRVIESNFHFAALIL